MAVLNGLTLLRSHVEPTAMSQQGVRAFSRFGRPTTARQTGGSWRLEIVDEPNPDRDPDSFIIVVEGTISTPGKGFTADAGPGHMVAGGFVFGGQQTFFIEGRITHIELVEYDVEVYLDGELVDPNALPSLTAGPPADDPPDTPADDPPTDDSPAEVNPGLSPQQLAALASLGFVLLG